jgi:hypothetical protein
MFDAVQVGVHNQLAGTIAELIAPAGFEYSAMMKNMFDEKLVFNQYLMAEHGRISGLNFRSDLYKKSEDMKKIAAWRVFKEK